jgi:DNA polymerase III epsilon subunit-like protein
MTDTYVSLDLEMTGVDLESDEIIEIGAVKFTRAGVLDRFATLVNPRRVLPRRIESLTGIRAAELKNAPAFEAVRDDFMRFVGDAPVVGQRVDWDLAFLAKHGLVTDGEALDTAELAEVMLPAWRTTASVLSPRALTRPSPSSTAVPDAEAAMGVFLRLLEQRRSSIQPFSRKSSLCVAEPLALRRFSMRRRKRPGGADSRARWPCTRRTPRAGARWSACPAQRRRRTDSGRDHRGPQAGRR